LSASFAWYFNVHASRVKEVDQLLRAPRLPAHAGAVSPLKRIIGFPHISAESLELHRV